MIKRKYYGEWFDSYAFKNYHLAYYDYRGAVYFHKWFMWVPWMQKWLWWKPTWASIRFLARIGFIHPTEGEALCLSNLIEWVQRAHDNGNYPIYPYHKPAVCFTIRESNGWEVQYRMTPEGYEKWRNEYEYQETPSRFSSSTGYNTMRQRM